MLFERLCEQCTLYSSGWEYNCIPLPMKAIAVVTEMRASAALPTTLHRDLEKVTPAERLLVCG